MTEPTPISSAAALADWLREAQPGDVACYHTGCLAVDRSARRLGALADAAYRAQADGLARLTQRRESWACWSYLVTRAEPRKRLVIPQRASAGVTRGRVREGVE